MVLLRPGMCIPSHANRTVFMYHAKDRAVDVPRRNSQTGGIHNSLTRLMLKPTHLIGGYAQLTFAFNYLGPTGNQR